MKSLFSAALLGAVTSAADDGKCRALVLSGGSDNGAWEAGVIWGLLHYGKPEDYTWDAVSGVSAGAINSGAAATWKKGTELEFSEFLSDQWASMTNEQLFSLNGYNPVKWIFSEPSVLDTTKTIETLNRIYGYTGGVIQRDFTVSAVDANTGEYIAMNPTNTPFENLAQSSMSSASIPVVFPPQHLNGYVFMDGGTVWDLNLDSAVQQCIDKGFEATDIIVDVAICGYSALSDDLEVEKNAYAAWKETNGIRGYYKNTNSIWEQAKGYPGLNVRYYFQERNTGCKGSLGGLNFNNSTTWCLQEAGRRDAQDMLTIGSEEIAKTFDEYMSD